MKTLARTGVLAVLLVLVACGGGGPAGVADGGALPSEDGGLELVDGGLGADGGAPADGGGPELDGGIISDGGDVQDGGIVLDGGISPGAGVWDAGPGPWPLRIVAANLTSGTVQSYQEEGTRILQALHPDVVLLQEFNVGSNAQAELRDFVTGAFGAEFSYFRGVGSIPNGIISRYPIVSSGEWPDAQVPNRRFTWARLALPGGRFLFAVSVHLPASNGSDRTRSATDLVTQLRASVPAGDLLTVGGDFNTGSRSEGAVSSALRQLTVTTAPYPVDTTGNPGTNANRDKPYDWVLASPALHALRVTTAQGSGRFAAGLVVDTRVHTPLSDVAPAQQSDSAAFQMQHMAVVRDFLLPVR